MTCSRTLAAAVSALALVAAGGCGGAGSQQSSGAVVDNTPSVTITSPQGGATVGSSFPLTFKSSVPIGALDTGEDHVHVIVDGNTNDFTVVTAHRTMVTNLSPGEHTVGITLQHADHSSAGAEDQVTVMVSKGGATKDGTMDGSNSGNSDGFSY
jgi:hypothetical protein